MAETAPDYAEVVIDDQGAPHRSLASRLDRRFLQLLPNRDRTTGFFVARFRRPERG